MEITGQHTHPTGEVSDSGVQGTQGAGPQQAGKPRTLTPPVNMAKPKHASSRDHHAVQRLGSSVKLRELR